MKRMVILLVALAHPVMVQADPLSEARKAIAEQIPQVAVQKLKDALDAPIISEREAAVARELLAEALLASSKHEEALEVARTLNANATNAVLRANIRAVLGRWEEALPLYREGAPATAARIGEAEALHALGRTGEAVGVLEGLVDSGQRQNALRLRLASLLTEIKRLESAESILAGIRPADADERRWKHYVEARILLAQGHADPARITFLQVLEDRDRLPDTLLFGATLGLTEALIFLEGYDNADKILETFIWRYPQSAYLEAAFRRLDQIYLQEEKPPEKQLHEWAQKPEVRRAALALFHVARLQLRGGKFEKAAISLNSFVRLFPAHSLLCEVHLMQADLHLAGNKLPQAVAALEAAMRRATGAEMRAEIELRTGLAHFQQGEFLLAANLFSAAERSPRLRSVAIFNAALAWLNQGNDERFQDALGMLGDAPGDQRFRGELLLERGLLQARSADMAAEKSLQLFLDDFPRHAREAEARLAIAELAFWRLRASAVPPLDGADRAEEYLRVANAAPQTPQTQENADYLAIFIADAKQPRDEQVVIDLARSFLRDRVDSPLVPEVQMKLGQVYFRKGDSANAETQFVGVSEKSPKSPYAESALFLAGQCAMKLKAEDRGLAYFKQVVDLNGPLKLYARQEQAVTQSRLGESAEAVRLYDLILAAAPDLELQAAALCGKGDNLANLGKKEPARLKEAVGVYDQLASTTGVGPTWRNQALYKKAKALDKLGRKEEAITAFYDVLEKSASASREYFWSYKAGYDAAALFEKDGRWSSAIGVYEKLALLAGPQTEDVRDRIKKLRLQHFIWE